MRNATMETLTWLDKPFLLKALNEATDIQDFHVLPNLKKGNNLLSDVYRAVVRWTNGAQKTTCLFFKTPYPHFEVLSLNEIEIYTSVLPKINEFLKGTYLFPVFYHCAKPENILVLEDLMDSGFQMSKQTNLIDYEHCEVGLKTIAKFHAASIAVQKKHPGVIEHAGARGAGSDKDFLKLMVDVSLRVLAEILDTVPHLKDYSTKLNNIRPEMFNGICDLFSAKGPNNVLNHGDYTVNNTMFKYGENNEVCDVRIFDFQLPTFGSFGLDLQTYLMSSARTEVLTNNLDDLLKAYQSTFNSTMSDCGLSNFLTLEDVKKEFKNADCFGIYIVSTLFSMRTAGAKKTADLKSFSMTAFTEKNDSPFRKLMDSEEYKAALPSVIQYFENRGLFDV